jgi:hypothetical protein
LPLLSGGRCARSNHQRLVALPDGTLPRFVCRRELGHLPFYLIIIRSEVESALDMFNLLALVQYIAFGFAMLHLCRVLDPLVNGIEVTVIAGDARENTALVNAARS